ncbi:ATP synthase subunit I [Bordetella genomosp. 13]|uniref:ABC transporter permease n=1 Tax=Bordetella genomosp. 13 TaxID=463040 RepID=A0A1W6Z7Z3_9BORD|nr:ATP synthase subunit I [Bordetella genomosp. 13]ARP93250.1 ABC transporter permease [Bordetella genomosp. 13]
MQKSLVLTDADRSALNARACREILLVLAAQAVMGLAAATIAGIFAGAAAGLSALLGAGAYLVPNALFALRLLVNVAKSARSNPFAFLFGELIKLFATALLLGLMSWLAREWLVWPAVLLGLILTLKGYLLLLSLRKLS